MAFASVRSIKRNMGLGQLTSAYNLKTGLSLAAARRAAALREEFATKWAQARIMINLQSTCRG